MSFKSTNSLEKRKNESQKIRAKYVDRIPVICESSDNMMKKMDKYKYLVPNDLTIGQFVYVIRKRIKLAPEKAIFMFVNNVLPTTSSLIGNLYEEHKDIDGFLYCKLAEENTFG